MSEQVVVGGLVPDLKLSNVKMAVVGQTVTLSADVDAPSAAKLASLVPFINLLLQFVK